MMKSIEIKESNVSPLIHPLLRKRWSARSFRDEPIGEIEIQSMFEAARWAASSMNEQPWMYIYATKTDPSFGKFIECMMGGNQPWAKTAPLVMLSLARMNFTGSGQPNRHAYHDAGAANTSLLLQAASMNIYGHMIGGFHFEKTKELFNLPESIEPVCFIVLGHLGNAEELEEPFRERELTARNRVEASHFAFHEKLPG